MNTSFSKAVIDQVKAADPMRSSWVMANAGSGKTRVLVDRVIRLLLRGVKPQNILCLTYTNAAAAEMQNGLFKRLGDWAMKADEPLLDEISLLGEAETVQNEDGLRQARTLFARALETPGGLKIQTIHSFCDAILRQFPLEAGVSPNFSQMDERMSAELCVSILSDMADGNMRSIIDDFALYHSGDEPDQFINAILSKRALFQEPFDASKTREILGLPAENQTSELIGELFNSDNLKLITQMINILQTGALTDQKNGVRLSEIVNNPYLNTRLNVVFGVCLTSGASKNSYQAKTPENTPQALPTKKLRTEYPEIVSKFDTFMVQAAELRPLVLSEKVFEKSRVLYKFAHEFLKRYEIAKSERGLLDYDDLISKAKKLLSADGYLSWVRYRMDSSIDHVLVDEAQDTSPEQWQVISNLTSEFWQDQSLLDYSRTIFVVGDEKQSIYMFQGADPEVFAKVNDRFEEALQHAGSDLYEQDLQYSFRSAEPILQLVDEVFKGKSDHGIQGDIAHKAVQEQLLGRVDLWPFLEENRTTDELPWYLPVDFVPSDNPNLRLADQLADYIDGLLSTGAQLPTGKGVRTLEAGDIMILVQRRKELFHAIIKALKSKGLAVAGADRLKLGEELGVKDIMSLLRFLATPKDDLALAEAIRSPLLGLSEIELFELANGRSGALWPKLRGETERFPIAISMIQNLLDKVDFIRPYELIEHILITHNGRDHLLGRLGLEAMDGINALLDQALQYEVGNAPSLTGFIVWMDESSIDIKRQIDDRSNQIRVMTVHGSKGLEAPMVILPDTAKRTDRTSANQLTEILDVGFWDVKKEEQSPVMVDASELRKRLAKEERARLLYVALTRAEQWLIICGCGKLDADDSWYANVEDAMQQVGASEIKDPLIGGIRSIRSENWPKSAINPTKAENIKQSDHRAWLTASINMPKTKENTISPSKLGGEKSLTGADTDADFAAQKGTFIHALLERLPALNEADWDLAAKNLQVQHDISDELFDKCLVEIRAILLSDKLAWLFSKETMAEVPISVKLPDFQNRKLEGIIDRLIVSKDIIYAIDFKSNMEVPENIDQIPEGILRQMGAYQMGLEQLYPSRQVNVGVLWSETGQLMMLSHKIVREALMRATIS